MVSKTSIELVFLGLSWSFAYIDFKSIYVVLGA
jgi:hypothetical protein